MPAIGGSAAPDADTAGPIAMRAIVATIAASTHRVRPMASVLPRQDPLTRSRTRSYRGTELRSALGWKDHRDFPPGLGVFERDEAPWSELDDRALVDAGEQQSREPSEVGEVPHEHEVGCLRVDPLSPDRRIVVGGQPVGR